MPEVVGAEIPAVGSAKLREFSVPISAIAAARIPLFLEDLGLTPRTARPARWRRGVRRPAAGHQRSHGRTPDAVPDGTGWLFSAVPAGGGLAFRNGSGCVLNLAMGHGGSCGIA